MNAGSEAERRIASVPRLLDAAAAGAEPDRGVDMHWSDLPPEFGRDEGGQTVSV